MKENVLAKKFTAGSLLRFAGPTVVMMVFMSLYTMVDGVFVSRFVSTTALSAVNIVFPIVNIMVAVGIMLGTGASALVASQLGEGKTQQARENFTLIVLTGILAGGLITTLCLLLLEPMLVFLGANEAVWQYCLDYMQMYLLFVPFGILQMLFQYFFVVAGRPTLGLVVTSAGGIANIILDYIFIVPLGMGVSGAALATGIGYAIPGLFGLWFFYVYKDGALHFARPRFRAKVLLKSCTNGSSEMVTNLAIAVITLMYNLIMMDLVGEDGVAAITIVLYAEYLLVSIYLGFSSGVAPVISYKYGERDHQELKNVFAISIRFIVISSLVVTLAAYVFCDLIVSVFAPGDSPVHALAVHGFKLYSVSFLFVGFNIFASAFFTALNNGLISALLSFMRTFLLIAGALYILPRVIGLNGVWLAVPLAEMIAIGVSVAFLLAQRKVYEYA